MDVTPKFMSFMSSEDCLSTHLIIPTAFISKFGNLIPVGVKLSTPNGYEMWVDFDKRRGRLFGMKPLFRNFKIEGGQSILFDFVGDFKFNVQIFDVFGFEIDYPAVMPTSDGEVLISSDGCSFVSSHRLGRKPVDEIVPPHEFIEKFGPMIPDRLEYVVSSGLHIVGSYCCRERKLVGVGSVCNILGVDHLNELNVLLFCYDGESSFKVFVFDKSLIETPVFSSFSVDVPHDTAFEILVQPYHMLQYCHGVNQIDHITAYQGNHCWTLQTRKRRDWNRAAIHDGWINFREDLGLCIGDRCVFEWKNDQVKEFCIRIVKNGEVDF
ncbi:hypothetical protein POM88_023595 [Heracleum sosnowskyi]|uniref:TF-B3 domain-containing protein n=1 Tax=Heracleum sosnowskyi TaxID=360622 RepID=A0AAD8MQM6_9APIA|nr:hypothetical protein POM88_023595 [Heracleum sosnowskyi]